ncbi:NB-ARC domain-containing protein [Nonomuraea sp. MG754425]|uniref:ATP-binding protein n=1 Tax=Nonomuraea sp. MG754425 TaxID=2570319 RepID=UPI001F01089C|nr:NB-ARC domain-containing protein [Nonomuraea sp. MG754425]
MIARDEELIELRLLRRHERLVTITGVAGVGKTRLALRAAGEWEHLFADGAWWVPLSPLVEPGALPYAIADALPLADQSSREPLRVLTDYLADREVLLVLDTCEHLIDYCALVVRELLDRAPGLCVLATSRRRLGLDDEHVLTLEPLPVPKEGSLEQTEAVTLLADRAAAARPGFTLNDGNLQDVIRICRHLEGLPLAIELAAARLREVRTSELADRLTDRLSVLGDLDQVGRRAEPPWHQALRTAIGWSHQLCSPGERLLWARVSVFACSFTAEAAVSVCADDLLPAAEIPGLLAGLADKSILTWEPTGGGERYRVLDTIREYGAFWLGQLGEQDELRRRHRDHYRALARTGEAAWYGPDQYTWYDRTVAEQANLRAALEHSLAEPAGHAALELAGDLWFYWYNCGFVREGRRYLQRALEADTVPSRARTKALWVCGLIAMAEGDAEAAAALATECTSRAEAEGDAGALAAGRAVLTAAAVISGDHDRVTALAERLRGLAPGPTLAYLLSSLSTSLSHVVTCRLDDGVTMLEQVRSTCDRHGERTMRAYGDVVRSEVELARGHPTAAQTFGQAALVVKQRMHDSLGLAITVDLLARAAVGTGQAERAAYLLGLAQQIWDTIGRPRLGLPWWVSARRLAEEQTGQALGDRRYRSVYQAGYRADLDTGIVFALSVAGAPPAESATAW